MHIAIAQSPGKLKGFEERINWAEKKIISIKNNKINHILNFYKVENNEFKKIF